eukprot:9442627-Heterocapsa_arctica.AAC.1
MSFRAAVYCVRPQCVIDVFPLRGALCAPATRYTCLSWPLHAYSLDGLGLDATRFRNSLVRANRRPAPGRCHRRPHRHVDMSPQR